MLRKPIKALLVLIALAGIAVGVAFYLLHDESFVKNQLHAFVFKTTGRSLTIDGALDLHWGMETTVEARGVRFSNASWANQPDMAQVGRLFIAFDLRSLFGKKPILRNIEIDDCQIDLVENDQNVSNWDVMPASDEPESPEDKASGIQDPGFQLDHARIGNCQITHYSPIRDEVLNVEITSLDLSLQDDGRYQKHATGIIDGVPLNFEGNLGPIRALWQGGRFDHDINLQVNDIELNSSGTVADTKTLTGANIFMNFHGPDIGVVIHDLALPPISTGAFDFTLKFNTVGKMTKIDINGDLGSLEAKVNGQLDRLIHPTEGAVRLSASGPNLGALAMALGVAGLVPDEFTVSADLSAKEGRTQLTSLIVETQMDHLEISGTAGPYPGYHSTELDISVHSDQADRWVTPFYAGLGPIGALDSKFKLINDQFGVTSIDGVLNRGPNQLKASGILGQFPKLNRPDLTVDFTTPDLHSTGQLFKLDNLPTAPLEISGQISKVDLGFRLSEVLVDLAGDEFRIDGVINHSDQFKDSKFNLDANIASTTRFAALFGVTGIPDEPLTIKSVIQPLGKGLKFRVTDGEMGEMKIRLDGQIANLESPSLIDSDFDVNLPSMKLLRFLIPEKDLPDLPISASGRISSLANKVQLQNGQFQLGQTTAQIDAQFQHGETLAGSSITISASGADLRELVSIPELESLPHDFRLSGKWASTQKGDQLEDIDISLGQMNLTLNGHADSLLDLSNFSIQAQLNVEDVSVLNTLLDLSLEAEPLTATTSLVGSHEDFDLRKLSVRHGVSDVMADIHVDRREKLKLSGSIESVQLDLRPYQHEEDETETPVDLAGTSAEPKDASDTSSKKLFDDTPIKPLQKSPIDLDLKIQVGKAYYSYTEFHDVQVDVQWKDHFLQLNPFQLSGPEGGNVTGKLVVDGRGPNPEIDLKLQGKDIRLGISAAEGQDPDTYSPVELNVDLHGSGNTRHALAKSVDGTIRMYWGSGLYAGQGLGLIFSDFTTELLTILNPFSKTSEYSKLECAVLGADVQSGKVNINPILIQDEKITIVSEGSIDLDTEDLNVVFNTKPRKGFGLSPGVIINSLVRVGGTLKSPAVEMDAGSAVVSGGAAVATVGLSLLAKSFADRFLSSKDPCGDARKKLEGQDSKKEP